MKILHVIRDGVFFDSMSEQYNSFAGVENLYIYITSSEDSKLRMIMKKNRVTICYRKEDYMRYFNDVTIDVVFLHSMLPYLYKPVSYIPKGKAVVWWMWGDDIYLPQRGMRGLIDMNLYKPITERWLKESRTFVQKLKSISYVFYGRYYKSLRDKAMKRVDFLYPVLPIEFDIINHLYPNEFRQFYANTIVKGYQKIDELSDISGRKGNVLIGNSANVSGNHLDILNAIKTYKIKGEYIIPLSYGDSGYKNAIMNNPEFSNKKNVRFLTSLLPYNEYTDLMSNCTHAIFGPMRQQAIGNISICVEKGMKLFFYKGSIDYRQFLQVGMKVFTIEDDLTEESLNEPLSMEEARRNITIYFGNNTPDKDKKLVEEFRKAAELAKQNQK